MAINLKAEQLNQALQHLKTFNTGADIVKTLKHPPSFTFTTRSDNEEKLRIFLEEVVQPEEDKELHCEGIPSRLANVLTDLGEKWGTPYVLYDDNYILMTDKDHLTKHPLPEGYMADTIKLAEAEYLTTEWPYTIEEATLLITKYDITNRPTVAVRDQEGKLVGWELSHYWVSPGMLKVLPQHRGKGLAKYIVSTLAQKFLKQGLTVFIHAEKSNKESINLHKKCGFWVAEETDAQWGYFLPKNNQQAST